MKVISIGTDRKVFEPGSPVRERQIEYGKLFEELHVVVINRGVKSYKEKISEKVTAYSAPSLWAAFRIACSLTTNYKLLTTISVQDPFEVGVLGVLLKMRYGLSLQIQLHADFNNKYFLLSSPLNFIRFFLAHLTLPYADGVRVVSQRIKDSIKELNENVTVLPIRVESQVASQKSKAGFSILTVARLEKEKDLETAIRAFKMIADKYPEVMLTIAGEGRERTKLLELTKNYNLTSKIFFIGWVSDLPSLYSSADIYISTSLFEGYGMSVVEAALHGLPLVISDAGVAGEIFKDGETCFVCKPGDVPGFVLALDKLLSSQDLQNQMGERAQQAAQKSVISKEKYLESYAEAMTATPSKASFVSSVFKGNRILRFIVSGGTSATTQILSLYIFTSVLGIWYLYSSILSYGLAIVISFSLQKLWAFQDKEVKNAHVQFAKYFAVTMVGLGTNTLLMYIWVDVFQIWYLLAQIITGVIIAVFNFFMYRKFVFKS